MEEPSTRLVVELLRRPARVPLRGGGLGPRLGREQLGRVVHDPVVLGVAPVDGHLGQDAADLAGDPVGDLVASVQEEAGEGQREEHGVLRGRELREDGLPQGFVGPTLLHLLEGTGPADPLPFGRLRLLAEVRAYGLAARFEGGVGRWPQGFEGPRGVRELERAGSVRRAAWGHVGEGRRGQVADDRVLEAQPPPRPAAVEALEEAVTARGDESSLDLGVADQPVHEVVLGQALRPGVRPDPRAPCAHLLLAAHVEHVGILGIARDAEGDVPRALGATERRPAVERLQHAAAVGGEDQALRPAPVDVDPTHRHVDGGRLEGRALVAGDEEPLATRHPEGLRVRGVLLHVRRVAEERIVLRLPPDVAGGQAVVGPEDAVGRGGPGALRVLGVDGDLLDLGHPPAAGETPRLRPVPTHHDPIAAGEVDVPAARVHGDRVRDELRPGAARPGLSAVRARLQPGRSLAPTHGVAAIEVDRHEQVGRRRVRLLLGLDAHVRQQHQEQRTDGRLQSSSIHRPSSSERYAPSTTRRSSTPCSPGQG